MKSLATTLFTIGGAFILTACGAQQNQVQEDVDPQQELTQEQANQDVTFIPGTHWHTTVGGWDYITVVMDVTETEITNFDVHHNDTQMFVSSAVNSIIEEVMQSQTTNNLAVVSGATVTTTPLVEAAKQVFMQATGEAQPHIDPPFIPGRYTGLVREDVGGIGEGATRVWLEFDEYSIIGVEIMYHMETGEEFDEEAVNEAVISSILEQQSATDIIIENAPNATTNLVLAIHLAFDNAQRRPTFVVAEGSFDGDSDFIMGVFTTEVMGRNAPITVGIGTTETSVYRVVVAHRETPLFAENVIDALTQSVINYQTYNIDVLSGATTSTNAILEGLQQVFEMASN